jgi:CRISP-associated protein Cas1
MGWRSVIISQHAKLSYSGNRMLVQTMEGINQIPIDDIYLLLIDTTNAVITCELINRLNKVNARIVFTDDHGNPASELTNNFPNNRNVERLNQQIFWDSGRKEVLWTKIIARKIENQIQVLNLCTNENLTAFYNELDQLEIGDTSNREAVVARKYFKVLFDGDFNRRKPSATNAALNYGYAILLSDFNREIVSSGLLTYFGIHHDSLENAFNLSCDLMEPFRPVIDYWVARKRFNSLTPDIKFGLVSLLNSEIVYNHQNTILKNAISKYVSDCIKYLNDGQINDFEVEISNEV